MTLIYAPYIYYAHKRNPFIPTCFSLSLMFLFERYGYRRANWQAFVFVIRDFVQHLITNVFFSWTWSQVRWWTSTGSSHQARSIPVEVSYCTSPIVSSIPDTYGSTYDSDSDIRQCIRNSHGLYLISVQTPPWCRSIFSPPFIHSKNWCLLALSIGLSQWVLLSFLALATTPFLRHYWSSTFNEFDIKRGKSSSGRTIEWTME